MVARVGRGVSVTVGNTTVEAVAAAVMKAIHMGPPEIIVNWPPVRPVILLKQLFPRLGEKLIMLASRKFTKRAAEASNVLSTKEQEFQDVQ